VNAKDGLRVNFLAKNKILLDTNGKAEMKKIIIDLAPGLDVETYGKMSVAQMPKYLRFNEVLFQLQILKKLLSREMVDEVENIDGNIEDNVANKRTYIFAIRESFNNFVYTYANCVYNLFRALLPTKEDAKEETNKIYDISELKKIIDREEGIRHVDVHQSPENRYDTLAYLGTSIGRTPQDKLNTLKATEEECIKEINIAYDKIVDFSKHVLNRVGEILNKATS